MQKNGNQEMKSKPNQVSWEERFDKKFPIVDVHRKFIKDLPINVSAKWIPEGRQELKQFIRSLLKEERKELENKIVMLKSDIAHAIGYCKGLGHPETYLEKQYPELVGSKLSKGKV